MSNAGSAWLRMSARAAGCAPTFSSSRDAFGFRFLGGELGFDFSVDLVQPCADVVDRDRRPGVDAIPNGGAEGGELGGAGGLFGLERAQPRANHFGGVLKRPDATSSAT